MKEFFKKLDWETLFGGVFGVIAIVAIILLLLIAVVCYCIFYVPAKNGIEAAEYLREIYNTLFG